VTIAQSVNGGSPVKTKIHYTSFPVTSP